jgi:hypothetical protein
MTNNRFDPAATNALTADVHAVGLNVCEEAPRSRVNEKTWSKPFLPTDPIPPSERAA